MVITILAGTNNYCVAFSTAKTGSTGSETPDGNTIYLFPSEIEGLDDVLDKRTVVANYNATQFPVGKIDLKIELKDCSVTAVITAKATLELNVIRHFIREANRVGSSKIYAFIWNKAENEAVKLSWNTSHVQLNYIMGRPKLGRWKMPKSASKIYILPLVTFSEITMP